MSSSVQLVLGDQLFPLKESFLKKNQPVLMIEDYGLCTHFKYHKSKILLFLSSMRSYRDLLKEKGFEVVYYDCEHPLFKKSYKAKVEDYLKKNKKIKTLEHYETSDHFFENSIQSLCKSLKLESIEKPNPMFLTSREDFKDYLASTKKPLMMTFYSRQRKRLNLLMDQKNKPLGGKWSFDTENRKKYPKDVEFPKSPVFSETQNTKDVKKTVDKYFAKHPGTVENFWLPTTEKETKKLLDHFIKTQFLKFGPYEDAIHNEDVFGFHSTLSPMMNMGLITPQTLVERIVERGQKNEIPLASIEGYIRQVIGWREFVRGIYDNFSKEMDEQNYWKHHRKMGSSWYDGTTGLQPLDDSIGKAQNFGYTHHIERLMILSNIMLLSEIDPKEVYQWFMEMFVDSADWVMAANVYGMGQMSEGGIFSTKPYVCGSNYILKMSNYKKGDWCETLDGLYWRFIEKNRSFFEQNPRMSMMTRHLDKMDKDKKKRLFKKATDFIENNTRQ